VMLPQVGQGALAVECRTDDAECRERLHAIDDTRAHAAVGAERAYLAHLGGGCDLPCGAYATLDGPEVVIDALLAAPDGHVVLRARARDASPVAAGTRVATELLERGGRSLLDDGDGPA
jgi:hydroxymethylbilane synthase